MVPFHPPADRILPGLGRGVALLLAALAASFGALAHGDHRDLTQYIVGGWNADDGLPHNKVQAIAQAQDGFLWVGTEGGIALFDGVRFAPFAPAEAPEFRTLGVNDLLVTPDGAVWIATADERLARYAAGRLAWIARAPDVPAGSVRAIEADRAGTVWAGVGGTICRLRGEVLVRVAEIDGRIQDLRAEADGSLLVAGGGRIHRLRDGALSDLSSFPGFPDSVAFSTQTCRGAVYAATLDGLAVLRGKRWDVLGRKDGLPDAAIADVVCDREQALWVATWSGLARWDGTHFSTYGRDEGLTDEAVYTLFLDRTGSVWLGTRGGGLNRFRVPRVTTYTTRQGITRNDVSAVLADARDRVWAVTSGAGPDVLSGDRWRTADPDGLLAGRHFVGMAEDRDGTVWFATDDRLAAFRDGRLQLVPLPATVRVIESIAAGRTSGLWLVSGPRLVHFETKLTGAHEIDAERFGELYWVFGEREDGSVWLGTSRGVVLWKDGSASFAWQAPDSLGSITTLHEGRDGVVWLGTDGSGLVRLAGGRATIFDRSTGLPDDWIQQIAEDGAGTLWLGSHAGLHALDPRSLPPPGAPAAVPQIATFGAADGMRSTYCEGNAQPRVTRSRDGRLWFSTSQGISVADVSTLEEAAAALPAVVTSVLVDGTALHGDGVRFPPGRGRVEINFSVAEFDRPASTRFRYRLDGFDHEWSAPTAERSVRYENLRPGSYRFRVAASDGRGHWGPEGSSPAFSVAPHLYQRPAFIAGAVCAVFALALFGLRGHTRTLQRRAAELEEHVTARTAELARERDAAQVATRARSEFLANMSHEIRTPLNGVIGMTDIVLEAPLPPQQRADLMVARHAADTLLGIVNDILDFSKIEAGRLSIESIPFDLRETVEAVGALLRPASEHKGLWLRVEYPGDVPRWVQGDPMRVRQIVLNFATNALKFTSEGGVTIRAERGAPPEIRLVVEDTGIGIPEECQSALFEQFSQVEASTARRYGGTGLGLAVSRQLAHLQGGRVGFESRHGQGSRFWVELPLPAAQPPAADAEGPVAQDGPSGAIYRARVLVAEDNAVNQVLIRRLLERSGCSVTLVGDGVDAVDAWATGGFDLVLMDCDMPRMDGFAATAAIRAREHGHRAPIVALTARAMAGDRERCLAEGMNDYLAKPIDRAELLRVLERWVPDARAERSPPAADLTSH